MTCPTCGGSVWPWEANKALRAEVTSMRVELARLFGEVREHHGMSWWASMLARIGERLTEQDAEVERLKAALRDMLRVTSDDGLLVEMMTAKEMRQRAREVLGEVEK